MGLSSTLANAMYGTSRAIARFERARPGERVLAAGACKAVRTGREVPLERGWRWVVSRRANLLVSSERLACGDWDLPVSSIQQAELLSFGSWLSRGLLLKLTTPDGHYQFGLQYDPVWERALPFPVERAEATLTWSWISVGLRITLLAAVFAMVGHRLGWW